MNIKFLIKLFNSALDPKDKWSVKAFRDGDEFGKNKLTVGINQMLTGQQNMRGSYFESDDLEEQLKENYEEPEQKKKRKS